ncbi:hypothetical protein PEPS_36200 (plasmid) [Persicobacter psychrovividus]|uniref:Pvc16 N-terminal domain-containing protein n=2 Tax=Persicobacter psychrovividus TaxID=387638 RepID=A0ABM7VK26_9BACT|nr:hypothetical protein PEPS_36200 [Persicobacter psychrovividus]
MSALQEAVEDYFRSHFTQQEPQVVLGNLVDQEGKPVVFDTDQLVITLANIEREQVNGRSPRLSHGENKPYHLKLLLLFSAVGMEGNYQESLKTISGLIHFFQANQSVTGADLGLDSSIEKLTFEFHQEEMLGMSNLWGMHGGRYWPSALFKVRIVTFDQDFSAPSGRVRGLGANIL